MLGCVGLLASFATLAAPLVPVITVPRTDFAVFGIGGLRGTGAGSIAVSGLAGTVDRAFLVWHGVANTTAPLTPNAVFAGTALRGINVGITADTTWGRASSQAFYADVTGLVRGNGNYSLSGMRNAPTFDPNGASLLVFYRDGNGANDRDIAVLLGNDSNTASAGDPAGWSFVQGGIVFSAGTAALTLIVSDGQNFQESGSNSLAVNATAVSVPRFQGSTVPVAPGSAVTDGGLWDQVAASITSAMVPGPNTVTVTGQPEVNLDALNLVAVVFDLPAGALPEPPVEVPAVSPLGLAALAALLGAGGLLRLRRRR